MSQVRGNSDDEVHLANGDSTAKKQQTGEKETYIEQEAAHGNKNQERSLGSGSQTLDSNKFEPGAGAKGNKSPWPRRRKPVPGSIWQSGKYEHLEPTQDPLGAKGATHACITSLGQDTSTFPASAASTTEEVETETQAGIHVIIQQTQFPDDDDIDSLTLDHGGSSDISNYTTSEIDRYYPPADLEGVPPPHSDPFPIALPRRANSTPGNWRPEVFDPCPTDIEGCSRTILKRTQSSSPISSLNKRVCTDTHNGATEAQQGPGPVIVTCTFDPFELPPFEGASGASEQSDDRDVTLPAVGKDRIEAVMRRLRQLDQGFGQNPDKQQMQTYTWNENVVLLLAAFNHHENETQPFSNIRKSFNREIDCKRATLVDRLSRSSIQGDEYETARLQGELDLLRPNRDRSSLRKRLEKLLCWRDNDCLKGLNPTDQWHHVRRFCAAQFVEMMKGLVERSADKSPPRCVSNGELPQIPYLDEPLMSELDEIAAFLYRLYPRLSDYSRPVRVPARMPVICNHDL